MKKIILYLFLSTLLFSNSLKVNNKNFFINNRIIYFNNFINNLNKIKDEKIIVKKVNIFVNKFKYKSDFSNYNKKDYWQTPLEMLIKGSGDCEDFALMKYIILKKIIKEKKLKLNFCKINNKNHMILIYNDKLVLDNINKKLLNIKKRKDLIFIRSFNLNQKMFYKNKIKDYLTRLNDSSNSIIN